MRAVLGAALSSLVLLACGDPAPPRILFVGLDGATWKVVGPLIEAGELPAFARLTREGAYLPEFGTIGTTRSPVVWNSVATGRLPEHHGILKFAEKLPSGAVVPVTSNARKVKAIWNVATDAGRSTGVIGWWASWPAEEVNGYVVTDHANPAAVGWFQQGLVFQFFTADPDELRAMARDFYPLEIAPILAQHWHSRQSFPIEEMKRRGGFSDEQIERLRTMPWRNHGLYGWLKNSFAIDYPLFTLSRQLDRERPVDLQLLYLRGPDPVQHWGWDLVEPERFGRVSEDFERDRGIVEGVYRYLDSFLGEILAEKSPATTLIVASDHGAEAAYRSRSADFRGRPGIHTVGAKGVLFIHGPHVKRGHVLTRGGPFDLMPTMAWLLGLPLSEELEGEVLTDAFDPGFVAGRASETVASYGARADLPEIPVEASEVDEELVEKLRGLGYLE